MAANQRSILSFFKSNSSSSSSQQPPANNGLSSRPLQPIAPRPPPAAGRYVPPPSASGSKFVAPPPPPPPPAATIVRGGGSGNSSQPSVDLPPITADFAKRILLEVGANESDNDNDDLVFPTTTPPYYMAMPRERHMPDLISVNAILLSVRYPDSFYKPIPDRTQVSSLFNRVLLTTEVDRSGGKREVVIGGMTCRLEACPWGAAQTETSQTPAISPPSPTLAVYIRSLALLSPYRSRGLAAHALDSIIATAQALNAAKATPAPIRSVYAHVWTESEEALQWYEARGFVREGGAPVPGYYYALRPDTAWIMRRDLDVPAATAAGQTATQTTTTTTAPPPPPPPTTTTTRPPRRPTMSFQNTRPETEWNDLPEDMIMPSASASASASASVSAASSRNASRRNLVLEAGADGSMPPPSDGSLLGPPPAGGPPLSSPSLAPPPSGGPPLSGASSQTSSRSSSVMRKKRDRSYPAAMFGQQQNKQ